MARTLAWFSCGVASAVATKLSLIDDPATIPVYCDTSASEEPDNERFFKECQDWFGVAIKRLKSSKYATIDDVFSQVRYMSGPKGARCTTELKKLPRMNFQKPDDVHIFGYTTDETKRIARFVNSNPELNLKWPLVEAGYSKDDCKRLITNAGIALPTLYLKGYQNNNCLGCVKASAPRYWNKIRQDYPEVFTRRAVQSRQINCRLTRIKEGRRWKRIFLDELPANDTTIIEEDLSCGPECQGK